MTCAVSAIWQENAVKIVFGLLKERGNRWGVRGNGQKEEKLGLQTYILGNCRHNLPQPNVQIFQISIEDKILLCANLNASFMTDKNVLKQKNNK